MRIYLPATLPLLAAWHGAGAAPAADGHAVTPTLREWYREGDLEELEYAATVAAARSSLHLLAADATAPRRRVVLAADVPDAAVTWGAGRSAVRVAVPVARRSWAAVLLDDPEAADTVSAAVAALPASATGDEDALFALDEADAVELAWYGVQEIDQLL